MNLPKIISDLVNAQNNLDNAAFANCFTETAVVFDEGHTYTGTKEIQQWITKANEKYKTAIKPIAYEEKETAAMLKAEVSGTFPGSPIVLYYHFEFVNGSIQSLRITG